MAPLATAWLLETTRSYPSSRNDSIAAGNSGSSRRNARPRRGSQRAQRCTNESWNVRRASSGDKPRASWVSVKIGAYGQSRQKDSSTRSAPRTDTAQS